jgi:Aspartyl protease
MHTRRIALGVLVGLMNGLLGTRTAAQNVKVEIGRAEALFREGRFDEADAAARAVLDRTAVHARALGLRGAVTLWRNQPAEAALWLTRALEQTPRDKLLAELLGEALYRQNQFAAAAPWFVRAGQAAKARKLESFGATAPYRAEGGPGIVRFLQTDPLPLVEIGVNDQASALFLLDTGGGEIYVDTALARALGLPSFGRERGTFGGDTRGTMEHSRVTALTIGALTIRDVPALIMPIRGLLTAPDGRGLDGVLGTTVLSRFLATIDYPGAQLILRPHTAALEAARTARRMEVPFWLAGDHYIVAWGRLHESQPQLFFVDTGLGGGAFAAPASTLASARVTLGQSSIGTFGGGQGKVRPYPIDRLSLGDVERRNLQGFAGVFPKGLEDKELGFHVGGLISHEFFKPFALTMDFVRMRLILTEPGN